MNQKLFISMLSLSALTFSGESAFAATKHKMATKKPAHQIQKKKPEVKSVSSEKFDVLQNDLKASLETSEKLSRELARVREELEMTKGRITELEITERQKSVQNQMMDKAEPVKTAPASLSVPKPDTHAQVDSKTEMGVENLQMQMASLEKESVDLLNEAEKLKTLQDAEKEKQLLKINTTSEKIEKDLSSVHSKILKASAADREKWMSALSAPSLHIRENLNSTRKAAYLSNPQNSSNLTAVRDGGSQTLE